MVMTPRNPLTCWLMLMLIFDLLAGHLVVDRKLLTWPFLTQGLALHKLLLDLSNLSPRSRDMSDMVLERGIWGCVVPQCWRLCWLWPFAELIHFLLELQVL